MPARPAPAPLAPTADHTGTGAATDHGPGCTRCPSRRDVLTRVGAATLGAAAVGVLAACSGGGTAGGTDGGGSDGGGSGDSGSGAGGGADGVLATVDDVPVGGALSATGPGGTPILLTQPTAGTIVGLSAVCTHQGCTVVPGDEELECPCHRSVFTLEGEPVSGPATEALPPFAVTVGDDGSIVAAGS